MRQLFLLNLLLPLLALFLPTSCQPHHTLQKAIAEAKHSHHRFGRLASTPAEHNATASAVHQPNTVQAHARRLHQQIIDPEGHPLNIADCVGDQNVFPYSAIGRVFANLSAGYTICMAALVAPSVAYTNALCVEPNAPIRFELGGSQCSTRSAPLASAQAVSSFAPDVSSLCGASATEECQTANGYGLVSLDRSFPAALQAYAYNASMLANATVNMAGWAGTPQWHATHSWLCSKLLASS